MITAVLAAAFLWFALYGRANAALLIILCVALAALLAYFGRHGHSRFLAFDVLAQVSRLKSVNSSLKLWTTLALMALCIASKNPIAGLIAFTLAAVFTTCVGGLSPKIYLRLLMTPLLFLALSGLALLISFGAMEPAALSLRIGSLTIYVTEAAQTRAILVMARALGAVSCLYMLSLSTPMSEIIAVMRRVHCPNIIITLMYLIYRFIFIVINIYHTMRDAAKSRLGYSTLSANIRTTGSLYANLLAYSYRHAGKNFDAMESRCFDSEIRFPESKAAAAGFHVAIAVALCVVMATGVFLFSKG